MAEAFQPGDKKDMLELKMYYSRHHNLVLKREDDTIMWMSVKNNFMGNELPMLKHVREEKQEHLVVHSVTEKETTVDTKDHS
jgi:hypothetical protein